IVHIAPLHSESAPESALPYESPRVCLRAVRPAGGEHLKDKLAILARYPSYFETIGDELRLADAVHVRCPANISLLAILRLALSSQPQYRWIKYAGNWQPENRQPWSYTLQRKLLTHNIHRGVVTINGQWSRQPGHIFSFNNPCLTTAEVAAGQKAARGKTLSRPLQLLFVGALLPEKGAHRVLQVAKNLLASGADFELHLLGDGPQRAELETWVEYNGLSDSTTFYGWLPRQELGTFYAEAHFIIAPSITEGWPKVLSEAMAYGVVPLAGAVSSIPQILGEAGAGMALPPEDIDAYVQAILSYIENPETWRAASQAGVETALIFTYDHYLDNLRQIFLNTWSVIL
ncbi:MAG: glycosyltransferase family 4 protein, partial [Anaerolineales bacterium]|nr:glycosyltransferase family 4 protein [Anaerolineales bacterium]